MRLRVTRPNNAPVGGVLGEHRGARAQPDLNSATLLLAAERALDIGATILRRGRSHIGALIGKGDRDFATDVDLHVESAIRTSLLAAVPDIPFLGEEEASEEELGSARWVLDPIDGTINFARDSPLCSISLSLSRYTIASVPSLVAPIRGIVVAAM